MPRQLDIPGLWDRGGAQEPYEAAPAPRPESPQRELLGGSHLLRFRLEEACIALDASAVRAAYANLCAHSPGQTWGDWADAIAWLVEPARGEVSAQRALSLTTTSEHHFPGAPRFLREKVRNAALLRALHQLISEGQAELSDGRPVGALALEAGDFALARSLLSSACDAAANSNARWVGFLGEAHWRLGDRSAAIQCWCRASLIDPSDLAEAGWLSAEPVVELLDLHDELELSDQPLSYLAVLADLQGQHPLDDFALEVPANASAPRRLAALLRAYDATGPMARWMSAVESKRSARWPGWRLSGFESCCARSDSGRAIGRKADLPLTEGQVSRRERYLSQQRTSSEATHREQTMAKAHQKTMAKKTRGQGMTEYIIIVALIAIAAIGVITLFGDNIKALFGMSIDSLAGDTTVEKRTTKSKQGGLEKKTLANFGKENSGY